MRRGVGLILVLGVAGCPQDPSGDSGETTNAATSTAEGPMSMSGAEEEDESDTTTTGPEPTTTGPLLDCVDENIGMAVGAAVSTGSSAGAGDDFGLEYCSGSGTTGSSSFTGGFTTEFTTGGFTGTDTDTFGGSTFGGSTFGSGDVGTDSATFGTGGSTFGSGGSTFGDTTGGGTSEDYVIQWTAPNAGNYTFSLDGSGFDTVLGIFPPMCGSTEYTCNDDCIGLQSALDYAAAADETVFIVIEGYGGRTGEFTLSIVENRNLECSGGSTTG